MLTFFETIMIFITIIIFFIFYFLIRLVGRFSLNGFFNYNDDIKNAQHREKLPPKKRKGADIFIGTYEKRSVCIDSDCNHVFCCGTTGSGKTVALSNFIKSAVESDFPILIVDGKGDIGKDSLLDICKQLKGNKKLYVVDLNNPEQSHKYNPFKETSPTIIKDMLINMTTWSEEHYKLNVERYLQRVIQLLDLSNIELSFKTIVRHLDIDNFMSLSASLLKKEIITKSEHIENGNLGKTSGSIASGSIARFSNLLESEIGTIFDEDGIDIYTALNENAIILFILNPLLYPEVSPLIGKLILIDSKKAVSKLFKTPKERSFFMFDEINVYLSNTLLDLVNKSRSANVSCILATQSLSDLDSSGNEAFREQIIENCNNYIIMRQNSPKNAEHCAEIIGTKESMAVTYQITDENSGTRGSMRKTRAFIFHPDDIKNLATGEAFIVSKDKNFRYKIEVNKPF